MTHTDNVSVDHYLREVSKYRTLTDEEERAYGRRALNGDAEAAEALVKGNLRFVISVAKKYQGQGLSLADLIQEGNAGLITASRKYDPTKNVKFISYGVWWIRQSILAALSNHAKPVRIPLNHPRKNYSGVSLDAPLANGESSLIERMVDESALADEELSERQLEDRIANILSTTAEYNPKRQGTSLLTAREARVLRDYFGFTADGVQYTLEEIGDKLGITRERVRQIKDRALGKLREPHYGLHNYTEAKNTGTNG